ncbi:MAG: leucine-rich repeat domain-containing protein [Thermoguttaceae bacterium]
MDASKPKRRWWQFSLRTLTLLVVVTLFAIPCGWIALKIRQANRERTAEAATQELGGRIISWVATTPPCLYRSLGPGFLPPAAYEVSFAGTQITDAQLEIVEWLYHLRSLDLQHTQVTNAGLQHLKGLNELEGLNLSDTKITDAGLELIKGLNHLRSLDVTGTQVTDEGVKKLQQALPNCRIGHFD